MITEYEFTISNAKCRLKTATKMIMQTISVVWWYDDLNYYDKLYDNIPVNNCDNNAVLQYSLAIHHENTVLIQY